MLLLLGFRGTRITRLGGGLGLRYVVGIADCGVFGSELLVLR